MTSTITSRTGQNQKVTINEVCEAGKVGKHFSRVHLESYQDRRIVVSIHTTSLCTQIWARNELFGHADRNPAGDRKENADTVVPCEARGHISK